MKKSIPTTPDVYAALRVAFANLVAARKKQGENQAVVAEAIGVLPNYVSNIVNGRKNLGPEVIARIDEKYPGWRDASYEPKPAAPEQTGDAYWDTIAFCYNGLTEGHRDMLAYMANKMYTMDNPGAVDIGTPRRRKTDHIDLGIFETEESQPAKKLA